MILETQSVSGKGPPTLAKGSAFPVEASAAAKEREPEKEKSADISQLESMAGDMQANLKVFHNVDLHFSVHKASGQVMVVVTDEETGKIIREIPSAEMLNLSAKLEEMMGLIFDQRV